MFYNFVLAFALIMHEHLLSRTTSEREVTAQEAVMASLVGQRL